MPQEPAVDAEPPDRITRRAYRSTPQSQGIGQELPQRLPIPKDTKSAASLQPFG